MKKVAFCFLIYDGMNHEAVWNLFFKNADPRKYSIYIHYVTNKPLLYFEKHKLQNCIPTARGKISLVQAQNLLLHEGLKDPQNTNFVFVSNSCVPFKAFDEIYATLSAEYSYFNFFPDNQCFPMCNRVLNYIEGHFVHKAHQWCILNRKHAEVMLRLAPEYMEWFKIDVPAPDEYCYITVIYYTKLEHEIITTYHSANEATTFTHWINMKYTYTPAYDQAYDPYQAYSPYPPEFSFYGLKNYSFIAPAELDFLLQSKCLLGRKFLPSVKWTDYYMRRITGLRITDGNANDMGAYEQAEQELVNHYILPDDVVLELGARYGSVSCVINSKLNNKQNQVVVEPDERVWQALQQNKTRNECAFHIVQQEKIRTDQFRLCRRIWYNVLRN